MKKESLIAILIVAVGFTAIFYLSRYLDANRINLPESYSDSDLDLQGKKLKGFALGAEGLLADWYWMRSLQYIGGKISDRGLESVNLEDMTSMNPRLLYPMLDNATSLDPKLTAAYSYGAIVLPAIDSGQAIELTEKGIRDNPDQWRLLQYLGYIHWRLKNYDQAADAYERGSRIPGAPPYFKLMAAKMRSDGGSRDTARAIYRQAMDEAIDSQSKTTAELKLKQLDAMDDLDVINRALSEHRKQKGQCAANWNELFSMLSAVSLAAQRDIRVDRSRTPVDPTGVPYRLDRTKCLAEIDSPASTIPPM